MDYLKLFNAVASVARPVNANKAEAKELEQLLTDTGFDSLDMLMIGVYLSEIFGVDEELAKTMDVKTVKEMMDFFLQHATKHPESIESAVKEIK